MKFTISDGPESVYSANHGDVEPSTIEVIVSDPIGVRINTGGLVNVDFGNVMRHPSVPCVVTV